ncbi:MAG: hypothetical protein ABI878_14595 [Acidobacteriota bacterium]
MFSPKQIFARINRGIILDVVVLIANTLLMTVLSGRLSNLFEARRAKEPFAEITTFFYIASICILPGIAAVLKFIAGNRFKPSDYEDAAREAFPTLLKIILGGQFILNAMFVFALYETRGDLLEQLDKNSLVSGLSLAIITLAIVSLFIYPIFTFCHFFVDTTSRKPTQLRFVSEVLADLCIFTNVILYQAFWGLLMNDLPHDIHNIVGRVFQFLFSAALIYIPPRIYYLADDGGRWITWVMILLANLPVLIRIFFF